MPLGYDTVNVRHILSNVVQELYAADAEQYLNHPWFSQFYIIDGGIQQLSGTAVITTGASGTVSKRSQLSGTVPIVTGASGNVTISGGSGLTYQTNVMDASDLTTYSFTSVAIGTAASDRRVIVIFAHAGSGAGRVISSATIGGVSASIDANVSPSSTGSRAVGVISAVVPTGTTATISVTLSSGATRAGIGVWTANGVSPTGNSDTDTNNVGSPNGSLTVTTTTGDIVVAGGIYSRGTEPTTVAWTGATERFESDPESSAGVLYNRITGADTIASGSSTVISFDETGGTGSEYWSFAAVGYA